jgi:hypothetical protein
MFIFTLQSEIEDGFYRQEAPSPLFFPTELVPGRYIQTAGGRRQAALA